MQQKLHIHIEEVKIKVLQGFVNFFQTSDCVSSADSDLVNVYTDFILIDSCASIKHWKSSTRDNLSCAENSNEKGTVAQMCEQSLLFQPDRSQTA